MTKAALHLVAKPPIPIPFDEGRGRKRIEALRAQLLAAAVRYVKDGKDGTRGDRLRTASNLSGVPLNLIEIEAGRG
jgi:hypothetical protein